MLTAVAFRKPQVVIGMDVASSEFHTEDGMYDLDFKVGPYGSVC